MIAPRVPLILLVTRWWRWSRAGRRTSLPQRCSTADHETGGPHERADATTAGRSSPAPSGSRQTR